MRKISLKEKIAYKTMCNPKWDRKLAHWKRCFDEAAKALAHSCGKKEKGT